MMRATIFSWWLLWATFAPNDIAPDPLVIFSYKGPEPKCQMWMVIHPDGAEERCA